MRFDDASLDKKFESYTYFCVLIAIDVQCVTSRDRVLCLGGPEIVCSNFGTVQSRPCFLSRGVAMGWGFGRLAYFQFIRFLVGNLRG